MSFEWDPPKAAVNLRKHSVDFADLVGVFEDPHAMTSPDDRHGEERFVTIGTDFLDRLLVVIWAKRGARIRVISARKATRQERREYEG